MRPDGQAGVRKGSSEGKAFQTNRSTHPKNHDQERRSSLKELCLNPSNGTLMWDGPGGVTWNHKGKALEILEICDFPYSDISRIYTASPLPSLNFSHGSGGRVYVKSDSPGTVTVP